MEVYEIKKNGLRRQPSTRPTQRSVKMPYLLSIVGIILVTSAALVVLHFFIGYRNLKEAMISHRNFAEKLQSPLCDKPFCNSKGCVAMAARLQDLMQPEADPCVDFYEFSCGGYGKSKGILSVHHSYTPADEAEKNVLIDIRKVLESPPVNDSSQTLGKIRQFYNSCLNTGQRDKDRTQSLRDWLSEINLSFDEPFETTWKILSARLEEYGIHTILMLSVKGTVNAPIEIIEIDCDAPLLQPDVYLNPSEEANEYTLSLYRELITGSVEFLPDMDAIKKKEFVDNVLKMETDIARAIQASEFRENILSEEHIQHIKEIWRSMIGDSIQEVEVISSCRYNLESILSVLDNATPKVSTTYVAWKMLLQILPHLGRGLRDLHYRIGLPFGSQEYPFTWQECASQLRKEMGLPVFKALLDAGYIRAQRIQQVKESFKETKRNFLLTFRTVDWAGALIRKLFLSKVKNMKLNLGYPELINRPEVMDTIFMNLEIGENYFQNVLNLKKFKTQYFFNRLWYGNRHNPISGVSLEYNPLGNNARYDYTKNTVHINLGLLRSPIDLYSEDIPKYLRFGEISLLARQMSHAFDTTGCFYDGKGKMWERMWWPETLVQKYDFYTDCLRAQLLNKTLIDVNNNETLNTIVADIGSFLVPYDGLISHLSTYQNEKLLPSLSLTKQQMYYVRIAQGYCKSGEPSKEENLIKSPRFRVNTAVSNMRDFGEVFNCLPQSLLNPIIKCNLF